MTSLRITLIGGPAALIEVGSFRLLTDPTFDAPGSYTLPHVTLEKLSGPALSADNIGAVDAVLLIHDQHRDNLRSSFDILGFGARLKMLEPGIATEIEITATDRSLANARAWSVGPGA
jgi:hypothetical protein